MSGLEIKKEEAMTQEELQLCKDLQPLFKRRLGEFQVGDNIYHCFMGSGYGKGIIVAIGKKRITVYFESFKRRIPFDREVEEYLLHIPRTIDDQKPERGLLGMLTDCSLVILIKMYPRKTVVVEKWNGAKFIDSYEGNTITLATLKALKVQEIAKL